MIFFEIDKSYRLPPPKIFCPLPLRMLAKSTFHIRGDPGIEGVVGTKDDVDLPSHGLRLDVCVQSDGYRLAVHFDAGDGVAVGAGHHQGLDRVGFSRSISIQSLLFLISTVIAMK